MAQTTRRGGKKKETKVISEITYNRRIFIHFAQELAQTRLLLAWLGRLGQLIDLSGERASGALLGTRASLFGVHIDILLDGSLQVWLGFNS